MSNIVKHTEFKKVVNALWNKVKENFVTEVKYDSTSKKLKYTKNGIDTDITNVVTKWGDLEYTTQSSLKNVFDKNTQVEDNKKYYFGSIQKDNNWQIVKIPCQPGEEFTIIKSVNNDSSQIGLFDVNGTHIQSDSATHKLVKGRRVYHLTIPNNVNNVSYFVISMEKSITNIDEVMVFKKNVVDGDIPTNYVPFADGASVIINSTEVALSFDTTGTNLNSATIHSAIKELDKKMVNAGGGTVTSVNGVDPVDGNVTVDAEHINAQGGVTVQQALNNKVNTSQIGNTAGQIPQIGNDGALHTSIMPALAITEVFVVANEQEMMTKTVQVGDVVVVENEDNATYMCKNEQASTKLDKFVPINTGLSVVKQVNTKKPDPTGTVTLDGTHINATVGGHNDTIQSHLETANNNIVAANNNIGSINSVVSSLSRDVSTVTSDLGNVKTTINNHDIRISRIESKKHSVKVGEVISTLNTTLGETYAIDGVTFLYIGRDKVISRNDYPQLSEALGITSGTNFNIPVIADITFRYDYNRTATRRHYIVAKM